MARTKRKRPAPKRKLGARARAKFAPGYPTQRAYPTPAPKAGKLQASGYRYKESVVFVGTTPDALSHEHEERIIKLVSDRARRHLAKRVGPVQAKVNALFAKTLPVIRLPNGEFIEIEQYEDDDFPNVGKEWEWRSIYKVYSTWDLDTLRNDLRAQFSQARLDDKDSNFVFIDSVILTFWDQT